MNKRDLKKLVNYTCSELFAECVAQSLYNAPTGKNDADALLKSIVKMHQDFICRISHIEPGMKAKVYFNAFKEKFDQQTEELVDQILNMH